MKVRADYDGCKMGGGKVETGGAGNSFRCGGVNVDVFVVVKFEDLQFLHTGKEHGRTQHS